jgi:hypothetical protein
LVEGRTLEEAEDGPDPDERLPAADSALDNRAQPAAGNERREPRPGADVFEDGIRRDFDKDEREGEEGARAGSGAGWERQQEGSGSTTDGQSRVVRRMGTGMRIRNRAASNKYPKTPGDARADDRTTNRTAEEGKTYAESA